LYYLNFVLYTCANVICIKFLLTYLLTYTFIYKWNEPYLFAFTPQPHSITTFWPVLIFRPEEGRILSWPECLVTNRGGLPAPCPSTNRARHRVTSMIETHALLLSQAATRSTFSQSLMASASQQLSIIHQFDTCRSGNNVN